MLVNTERAQQQLSPASQEDLSEMGYAKQEEFMLSAEGLLDSFSRRGRMHGCRHSGDGLVFAFQNEADKFDFLVARGAKLVYKTMGSVFVSNRNSVVLKNSAGLVCINNGRSVVPKR